MLQRSSGKPGARLNKTTGWVHRAALKSKDVKTIAEVEYLRIDDRGLHCRIQGQERVLEVDNVILCAGQESVRDLHDELRSAGMHSLIVGGALLAGEVDAKRAIEEGVRAAAGI